MATDCTRKKTKKREICEERSPLRHLNGLRISTRNYNLSSSSSAPAASTFSISDNPTSSSSFYSSSTTHLEKKQKTISRLGNNDNKLRVHASNVGPRSKENEMPRKPFMPTSRKEKPQFITQRQNWTINAKPTCKIRQRSKLSSVQGRSDDKMKKGSQEFQGKMKDSMENDSGKCTFKLNRASIIGNSNCAENCTPVSGRLASGYVSQALNICDHEFEVENSVYENERANTNANTNSNSSSDVKTPPVEPSVSPEIQCQSQSKMLALKSVGTPVCYGAGHLLSGVSDKRRSRRRGSLRGGPGKAILFSENVSVDLKESSIPLLAEASIRWHLSPSNVEHEDHVTGSGNRLDQSRMACDDGLGTLDTLSSPSMVCGNKLDFLCDKHSYGGSAGNVAANMDDQSLLATSPNAKYRSNGIRSIEGKYISKSLTIDSPISSGSSLNGGNIIQTPESDCSSDACLGKSRLEVHLSNSVWPELDPITKTLERMKLLPRSEISTWDAPGLCSFSEDMGLPPISLDPSQLQRNGDCVSSWASDNTIDNLTLSQMRISWCDVSANKTDEFDNCCLSDEAIEGDESAAEGKENESKLKSVGTKEDGFRIEHEFSPVVVDYEPCIPAREKGKLLASPNACAESICTNEHDLLASDDSDWTCFQETACFMSP